MSDERDETLSHGIAIVGMVGRFPGARDLETFWRNICDGKETISFFADEELDPFGLDPAVLRHPSYVKAKGIIDGVEQFDPAFFGYSGRDALLMDPQHRLFLECCWEALETAGYDPRAVKGLIGVYAGATQSSYQPYLYAHYDLLPNPDALSIAIANDLPFLTTRVSYKLDLKGPSCPVTTACSTSLVAIHLACQGLLNAECDLALAGGASLRIPQKAGYFYQEESILSPDGHCRSFDARAAGTVFSNGLGVVALKRLDDALADGDTIYAVIRGSAINNDGSRRASFTAPGVYGQSQVIADALASADVSADTIGYVEAHGTATSLGDSIEIQALQKTFGRDTSRKQYCAIGTIKSNIGHLDAAAGVAGLIKAALMLHHRQLPPAAMFERPNPDLHLEDTAFFVNTALKAWQPEAEAPRRAGVSSFGFGGTNAHVVLEEAPEPDPTDAAREWQVLPISAGSADGVNRATANLAGHLRRHPRTGLADAAYTLQVGRRAFAQRRAVVCRSTEEAAAAMESLDANAVFTGAYDGPGRQVVFMFPGQGSQHVDMARGLYDAEPLFRSIVDDCAAQLVPHLGVDLRTVMFPADGATAANGERLTRTSLAQPALFVIEYALAKLYLSWGIRPDAMIGHSVGEWVAACLAGVLELTDALKLVALRGRLMEEMPRGVMMMVPLPEASVRPMLGDGLWLAALNAPSMCVVSGSAERIDALHARLQSDGIDGQRLQTSHAFHSGMMDAAVPRFVGAVRQVRLTAPSIPFVSNVSGALITAEQATDPAYWGKQIREAVRFADGVAALLATPDRLFVEVGPGQALTTLVRRQAGAGAPAPVASLRRPQERAADAATVAAALAKLWIAGARIDWTAYHAGARRRRIPLPTYQFDRQRYWVSRASAPAAAPRPAAAQKKHDRIADVSRWFYIPGWTRAASVRRADVDPLAAPASWLVFADAAGVADACVARLRAAGHRVTVVREGTAFRSLASGEWAIDPFSRRDYDDLLKAIAAEDAGFDRVLHCWGAGDVVPQDASAIAMQREHYVLFWSLTLLTQALADANAGTVRVVVVTTGAQDVTGDEPLRAGKATSLGVCRVIPQEHPNLSCVSIDLASADAALQPRAIDDILHEASTPGADPFVAYRGGHRWVETFRPVALPAADGAAGLRPRGVYAITGGLGDIALNFAEYLARTAQARLVLIARSVPPDESAWDAYLRRNPKDLTALRIQRLRRIQSLGGDVLVLKADVTDPVSLSGALAQAEARFGPLNGVIHAPGLVTGDAFRTILETDDDIVKRQFEPKVTGLLALDAALGPRALDFCMLVSSLSVTLGGLRYAAYASANAFLDGAARARTRTSPTRWITVNWDGWIRAEEEAALAAAGKPVTGFLMTGAEGADAFGRILAHHSGPQVVVSTGDLQTRLDQWVKIAAAAAAPETDASAAPAGVRLPRPNLQTDFVAPRTDLEKQLAAIWQNLLGLERVGVNDSFFELGGDSLLGIQLTSTVKKQLDAKISAVTLFEAPTIAALAALLQAQQAEAAPAAAFDASRARGERRREKKLRAVGSGEALGA
ncbi:MAG TPA: SDR family oxidoreductase [Vicinamibacterales bacterium]|nr:SDR family oxidoreductase [Vicinamibacterales bacterium]